MRIDRSGAIPSSARRGADANPAQRRPTTNDGNQARSADLIDDRLWQRDSAMPTAAAPSRHFQLKKLRERRGGGSPRTADDPPAGRGNKEDIQLVESYPIHAALYR
jgi:hypothetical protein